MAAVIAFAVVGCASGPPAIKMEPRSVAKQLGYPNCKVSVPLAQAEVIEMGRKLQIYPNPEGNPEWNKMIAIQQPGDQLRLFFVKQGTLALTC
jgi:hypothetical protein